MRDRPIGWTRILLFGLLTWLVPLLVAVPLMDARGQPRIPEGLFKSIMAVVGAGVGAILLLRISRRWARIQHRGIVVGLLWLGINLGLDLLVLVPFAKMTLPVYFSEIGVRYLVIPIMAVAIDRASAEARTVSPDPKRPCGPRPAASRPGRA